MITKNYANLTTMSLVEQLAGQLSGPALEALAGQLGADQQTTSSAITAALPMIVGAMAKNASTEQGASALAGALERDHDGSILDNLGGFLGSTDNGAGAAILGHVFGGKQGAVEQGVSQMSGMDSGMVSVLLQNLAPIVMGQLGRQQRQGGMDAGSIAGMLINERQQQSGTGSTAMDMITRMMDQDGDGSMLDDIGGMLGKLF